MMKRIALTLAVAALCAPSMTARPSGNERLNRLVETERKFAAMSLAKNTTDAFLAYFDDESILFTPYAAPARPYLEKKPKSESLLTWDPSFAVIAASGDLGYTTGPWEIRKKRSMDETPVAFGHFVTVWRLRSDGEWKVAVDLGIGHEKPNPVDSPWQPSIAAPEAPAAKADWAASKKALDDADSALSSALVAEGAKVAYESAIADDGRIYRDDTVPAVGRTAALSAIASEPRSTGWKMEGGGVSGSGDLGYTYGRGARVAKTGGAESVTYLRIWRRAADGAWKIALDVLNVVPPETPAKS